MDIQYLYQWRMGWTITPSMISIMEAEVLYGLPRIWESVDMMDSEYGISHWYPMRMSVRTWRFRVRSYPSLKGRKDCSAFGYYKEGLSSSTRTKKNTLLLILTNLWTIQASFLFIWRANIPYILVLPTGYIQVKSWEAEGMVKIQSMSTFRTGRWWKVKCLNSSETEKDRYLPV